MGSPKKPNQLHPRLEDQLTANQRLRLRQRIRRLVRPAWLGTLRTVTPLSTSWGLDRGTPVDRYYIEQFLRQEREAIRGSVLEVKDALYTQRFGAAVERSDVLDVNARNTAATIIADLAAADNVPSEQFDCFILTQVLQLIGDVRAAIRHTHRILRPGGVLLATLPGLCRVEPAYRESDYWRFTAASCQMLFSEAFGADQVRVWAYGNVLAAMAFLTGMAQEELSRRELDFQDSSYPVVIAVRAQKPMGSGSSPPAGGS